MKTGIYEKHRKGKVEKQLAGKASNEVVIAKKTMV